MSSVSPILERGRVYTPTALARWVAARVWHEWELAPGDDQLHVLDPACGTGSLLDGLFQVRPVGTRPHLSLYGVDREASAIESAALRFARATSVPGSTGTSTFARFVTGDSLTGAENLPRPPTVRSLFDETEVSAADVPGVDWTVHFPEANGRGGFDLILANPPYVRERSARELFQSLARTPLGQRYREPRMDLWFYFLHLGLDLVRPGGLLAYLIPSFWLQGSIDGKLMTRLCTEAQIVEVTHFERWPIFPDVFGRHVLLLARKRPCDRSAVRILRPTCSPPRLRALRREECLLPDSWTEEAIPAESLFPQGGQSHTTSRSTAHSAIHQGTSTASGSTVGDRFEVRQGIAENPPRVTRPIVREFGDLWPVGTGVFLLTSDELKTLDLSDDEQRLVRPYYAARALGQYTLPAAPTDWLLYLTPQTVPDETRIPVILQHLDRFRPLLERRREVQRRQLPWWGLHWPREERLFVQPRLLVPQMGERPRAVFVTQPAFVGFSTNVIVSRNPEDTSPHDLLALCAVINSRTGEAWFDRHAKRRGVAHDIGGNVLRRLPWNDLHPQSVAQLAALVSGRQQSAAESPGANTLDREIEAVVSDWLGPQLADGIPSAFRPESP